MYDITPFDKYVEIKTSIIKPKFSSPFEKTIKVNIPVGYTYSGTCRIAYFSKDFILFLRCVNDLTQVNSVFILTRSGDKFKFIDFLEIKNYIKNRYKLRKSLPDQQVDDVNVYLQKGMIKCVVTSVDRGGASVRQLCFEKTEDKKWFLYEKRNISFNKEYMANRDMLLDFSRNVVSTMIPIWKRVK